MSTGRFDYVQFDAIATEAHVVGRRHCEDLEEFLNSLPKSRAQSLALTKLEEVYMWVGKALRDDQLIRTGQGRI
jgi:hypothetical protein